MLETTFHNHPTMLTWQSQPTLESVIIKKKKKKKKRKEKEKENPSFD
jgi:hypothetical protein